MSNRKHCLTKMFFPRKYTMQMQLQGLQMIRDGMRVQEDIFRGLMQHLEEQGKLSDPNYIQVKARHHTVSYWVEEVEKALRGDLHF